MAVEEVRIVGGGGKEGERGKKHARFICLCSFKVSFVSDLFIFVLNL